MKIAKLPDNKNSKKVKKTLKIPNKPKKSYAHKMQNDVDVKKSGIKPLNHMMCHLLGLIFSFQK